MGGTVRVTQLYLENLVAGTLRRAWVLQLSLESVHPYQAAPPALRVTQAYLESIRSRQDAPDPLAGAGGRTRRCCRSESDTRAGCSRDYRASCRIAVPAPRLIWIKAFPTMSCVGSDGSTVAAQRDRGPA